MISRSVIDTLIGIPAPYRFRSIGTSGTPLLYPRQLMGFYGQVQDLLEPGKPVNDSNRQPQTVTLTVNQTLQLTVTVTALNRYRRVQ